MELGLVRRLELLVLDERRLVLLNHRLVWREHVLLRVLAPYCSEQERFFLWHEWRQALLQLLLL